MLQEATNNLSCFLVDDLSGPERVVVSQLCGDSVMFAYPECVHSVQCNVLITTFVTNQ